MFLLRQLAERSGGGLSDSHLCLPAGLAGRIGRLLLWLIAMGQVLVRSLLRALFPSLLRGREAEGNFELCPRACRGAEGSRVRGGIRASRGAWVFLLLLLFIGIGTAHAQSAQLPDPAWPLDSVINGTVKKFTITGDPNYTEPSDFTWVVYGGRLFFDEALTQPAGDGSTVTVKGDLLTNTSVVWVIWDVFSVPSYDGWIYVSETSPEGCSMPELDENKYRGMNIRVNAPCDVRFILPETLACSYDQGVNVEIEIEGFPPFNIVYSLNGEIFSWDVVPGDLIDSDLDGRVNNLVIPITDFYGTTVDRIYQLELLEASSQGIPGDVLEHATHTVYAFVQPDAPVISADWVEITAGQNHTMTLSNRGVNVAEWIWELYNSGGELVFEASSATEPYMPVTFDFPEGAYNLLAYFQSTNSCYSLADTLPLQIFAQPTLAFADTSANAIGCSAVSTDPDDAFEFTLDYRGALSYDFTYGIFDFNDVLIAQYLQEFQMTRNPVITIPNTFINDLSPEMNRTWKVRIINARNGEGVQVEIIDGTRSITIHPKPAIMDDIDFAN